MTNILKIAVLALMTLTAKPGSAQEKYPVRPVRIIVPTAAGGPSDVTSRLLAQELGRRWGQSVVVENRAGAATINGTELASMARIRMVNVPYKGDAPGIIDLLGGRLAATMSASMGLLVPHIRSGKLHALGVTTAARTPMLPDVPTIAEAGVPGYEAAQWTSLLAPAKTPRDTIALLHKEVNAILRSPEVKERLAADGSVVVASTPEAFGEFLKAEIAKWARVVKLAGIEPE